MFRLLLIGLCVIAFTGCAKNKAKAPQSANAYASQSQRMIIKTLSMGFIVGDLSAAQLEAQRLITGNGGFTSNNNTTENYVSISAKIPEQHLDIFKQQILPIGELDYQHQTQQDITEQFRDTEAKLNNLLVLRERYRALIAKSSKVSEMLEIERELARLQTEIDQIEGQKKTMQQQVAMADVDIRLTPKSHLGPLGYLSKGAYLALKKLFIWD